MNTNQSLLPFLPPPRNPPPNPHISPTTTPPHTPLQVQLHGLDCKFKHISSVMITELPDNHEALFEQTQLPVLLGRQGDEGEEDGVDGILVTGNLRKAS
jgi:hypothetical protein